MKLIHGTPSSKHDLYFIWKAMWYRCYRADNAGYKDYGARGIGVCERWKSLENFATDMGPRGIAETLDRIDNNGDYTPENCRWTTMAEQMKPGRNQLRCTNKSGVRGVFKRGKNWEAYVTVDYMKENLYYGPSFEAAVEARKTWETNHA